MRPNQLKDTLVALLKTKRPLMIHGAPGIGKSTIVRQAADELGYSLTDVRATLLDPVDLRGIPTVHNGQTKWCPPEFLPTEGQGVLFLDEIAQAPTLVQSALMQLVLDRRLGEYSLPPDWTVVAASNRQEDRAGTHRLITPLLNRLVHLDLEVSPDDWQEWAVAHGIAPEVRAFIRFKPQSLFSFDPTRNERSFATPRSWSFVSDLLNKAPDESLSEVVRGCVGDGPGTEFMAFVRTYKSLPDMDQVLANPTKAPIPTEPSVLFSVVGALVEKVRGDQSRIDAVVSYGRRLPKEFGMLALQDLVNVNKKFITTPGMKQWVDDARAAGLFQKI